MDFAQAWSKVAPVTKMGRRLSAGAVNGVARTLDALAPTCAPFAARWDEAANRRMALRTPENLKALLDAQRAHNAARSTAAAAKSQRLAARKASNNPLSAARRASRTADKAARQQKAQALAKLQTARKNYPDTLTRLAVKAHAAHTIPAGIASYVLSTPTDWAMWPGATSLGLIAANVAALAIGRRHVTADVPDELSAEERRLAQRLDPSYWVQHADERGLSGTVPTPVEVTPIGLVSHVRLDGRWTPKTFRAKLDEIRALLGARTDLRVEIRSGSHSDRATILLRTRSSIDADSLVWTPDSKGVGIDLETGEPVVVPIEGTHKGIAAATNMGKSTFWRPWMMEAVANPLMAGVLLDPKRQEARMWRGKIRTEGHQRDGDIRQYIYDAVCELEREMRHRQSIAEVTQWVPTPEYPILLVVIEEMANIVRMSKEKAWKDILDKLDGLFSEARAAGMWFIWATQFPSRSGGGITPQIAENTLTMVALTTEGPTADAVIFGNDGPGKGWKPSELGGIPGRALVKHKKSKPHAIQGWYVTDDTIKALPDAEVWKHRDSGTDRSSQPGERRLTLVKAPLDAVPAPREEGEPAPAPVLTESEAKVLAVLQAAGQPQRHRDLVEAAGVPKATVSKALKGLTDRGLVARDGQTYTAAAGEVSA